MGIVAKIFGYVLGKFSVKPKPEVKPQQNQNDHSKGKTISNVDILELRDGREKKLT